MEVVTGSWRAGEGWTPAPADFAAAALAGGERTLALVFADPDEPGAATAIEELRAVLPAAVLAGCSTAGQILGESVSTAPVVAVAAHFDAVTPTAAWAPVAEAADVRELGRRLGARLAAGIDPGVPCTVLVLADGIVVNGTALVQGLREALPPQAGISGGLAGDGARFGRTWVLADGALREESVVAVCLAGSGLRIGYGSSGGWEAFGPARTVTGSAGNVLHTLDDRPALALYREYLGDRADQLPASALLFPLLLRSPDGEVELVRTVLGVEDADSTMTFAGDIPQGWTARLMRTTLDRLVDAAGVAAEEAGSGVPEPQLAIAVSCVGRRLVLGQRTDEEVEEAAAILGSGVPLVGFYSYGEISPHSGTSELHNQTMTLTTLGETA